MKNLDGNQIKIIINLEIIGEEEKNKKKKKLYLIFFFLKSKNISTIISSELFIKCIIMYICPYI